MIWFQFGLVVGGPLCAWLGWNEGSFGLFWFGAFICAVNLWLDSASGVMKAPLLPAIFIIVGAINARSWYIGAAYGLAAWTVVDAAGMVLGLVRRAFTRNRAP